VIVTVVIASGRSLDGGGRMSCRTPADGVAAAADAWIMTACACSDDSDNPATAYRPHVSATTAASGQCLCDRDPGATTHAAAAGALRTPRATATSWELRDA
jgi:hypothetical protein